MALPAQTDLLVWLRADSGLYQTRNAHTSPATADGDAVGTWADRSGGARDCYPDVIGNAPTMKTAIYGSKNVVRFNGSSTNLTFGVTATVFSGVTAAELFVVVKKTGNSDGKGIFTFDASGNSEHHRYTDTNIYESAFTTGRATISAAADFSSAFHVYNVISVAGEYTVNFDGSQLFTRASNTYGVITSVIGNGGASNYLGGDIAEFVIYNRKLTSLERSAALTYFQDDTSWAAATTGPHRLAGIGGGSAGPYAHLAGNR